jgi:hypothetical protein
MIQIPEPNELRQAFLELLPSFDYIYEEGYIWPKPGHCVRAMGLNDLLKHLNLDYDKLERYIWIAIEDAGIEEGEDGSLFMAEIW